MSDPIVLAQQAAEIDDTAAEMDDADPAPDETDDDEEASVRYVGTGVGGPYDGRAMTSRYPSGVLLVDRPHDLAWVYDYAAPNFNCRDAAGAPVDSAGRWRAAEEDTYDVVAFDDGPEL